MTAPVTRFTIATPVPSATRTGGYDMAYTDVVLASDYERLEQEFEKLRADADLYRQWFNAVQDLSPQYLEQADYQAAARLLESLGLPIPSSVSAGALQDKPDHIPEPTKMVSKPPGNCRQRLARDGLPHPRSGCDACGKFSPMWRDCDQALQAKP